MKSIVKKYGLRKLTFFFFDCTSLILGAYLAAVFTADPGLSAARSKGFAVASSFIAAAIIFTLFSFRFSGLYKQRVYDSAFVQLLLLLRNMLNTFLVTLILFFFLIDRLKYEGFRTEIVCFIAISYSLVFVSRTILRFVIWKNSDNWNLGKRNVIAIGAGKVGSKFAKQLRHTNGFGLNLVGFLDDNPKLFQKTVEGIRVMGSTSEIQQTVRERGIHEIFITISSINHESLLDLIEKCRDTDCQINIVSNHFGVVERKVGQTEFKDLRCVSIRPRNIGLYQKSFKRIIDLVGGILILAMTFPLLIVLAILIKLTSKGPIFYSVMAMGKNGQPFRFYKLRSMVDNAPNDVHKKLVEEFISGRKKDGRKIINDPRVTKIGRFMRKYSLDEFGQLINVIKGDMSLVGPRPSTSYEYEMMKGWHRRRFNAVPGMTGLWQVSGRAEVGFTDMIMLDIYYIENCSFDLDLIILLRTIDVVISGKGGS